MPGTVAIVGASVGGVRTAQALRAKGYDGRVVLVGAEPDLPYDKPPLSKHFLAGTWDTSRITLLDRETAAASGIDLRLGVPAEHLDVAGHTVVLADGTRISYDTVVLATGSAARLAPWPAESGVRVIRSVADSRGLRTDLDTSGPVVVVGGGFIGAEIAGTLHTAGRQVTVVDPLPCPIGRVLGPEVGALVGDVHRRHGVATHFGTGVQDIEGHLGDLTVTLTDGAVLRAAVVVAGIGATPNVSWLETSGLLVEDGLVCDRFCRAVDRPDVYAVGDIARWYHPGHDERVRVEHWTNAVEQANCVAHNIVHPGAPHAYEPTEYVWSDQYDWRIQIVGRPHRGDGHEVLGDPRAERPRFAAVYRDADGLLCGGAAVNWPKALLVIRRLVTAKASYEEGIASVHQLPTPAGAS
ncbi:FAD/NAD(P)-binding oxidoreductase [Actinophytocola sp.]|uniref:NAD(P)/FAD-dependent oxidoreductase n=1 Tax=Actinophytocola sp. TaxID=1872138 RepID=UPI002EDB2842